MTTDLQLDDLRARGFRLTPQRLTILRIITQADSHLTPVEIFQQARAEMPGLTEATVYRSLNFLVDNGLALVAHLGGGQLVYEAAGHDHNHLICRSCGGSIELDPSHLDSFYRQLAAETGFEIDSPHMTFFGLCPDCQN